jgi:small subunit ribosomal protein S20
MFYNRNVHSDYFGGMTLANIKSAEKQARQALVRRERNQQTKKAVRTAEKKVRTAIATGDKTAKEAALREFSSAIDKAAKKGVYKKQTASRKISRLSVQISK